MNKVLYVFGRHCLPAFFFNMYLTMNQESSWKQGVMAMPRIIPMKNFENRVRR
jgi:hypothetical protein